MKFDFIGGQGSGRGILDNLMAKDESESFGRVLDASVGQVKMSNGRTAGGGGGEWKRVNGKWVQEAVDHDE